VGRELDEITPELQAFLEAQPMFFVATAPASTDEHVNVSPKGYDSFRVLGPHEVAYLDLTGSGIETISHLRENARITLMFCAFQGKPDIVRLQGRGRFVKDGEPGSEELFARFPDLPGSRAVIVVDVARIATSCGYGVPLMEHQGPRTRLLEWADARGEEGLEEYRANRNATSISGLPGWT
jgi:predicted pyridoxine 5'-phosphate oxidase superfamily flavin-nucleotide-binding protein